MQIARLVAHARLRVSSLPLPPPPYATKIVPATARGFERYSSFACPPSISASRASRLFQFQFSATGTRAQLREFQKAIWPTSCAGWRLQTSKLLVVTAATGLLGRVNGVDAVLCEKDSRDTVWSPHSRESASKDQNWDDERTQATVWVKRLWFPILVVTTVLMGWHYPVSLFVNLIVVLWSTKPSPASIYIWAEQRRMEQQTEKRGFDRLKAQLPAAVMHVEVEDYMLFCLARVSSLTQKSLVIGLLGDWWSIYSSSSSITAPGFGSFFPTEKFFPPEKIFTSSS